MPKFTNNPVLNPPYDVPGKHWKLDGAGVPTGGIVGSRRSSNYLMPVPAARRHKTRATQLELELESEETENTHVNQIRDLMDKWRKIPIHDYGVTHVTKKLLLHWRNKETSPRLFFCQLEAIETLIWLNEVAPKKKAGKDLLARLKAENEEANPKLFRVATKMATGAGKTVVMAMLIAYHSCNKSRNPNSSIFANHFLVVTPGITIKNRLRVLLPHDQHSDYQRHNLIPSEFHTCMQGARVTITNYHTFQLRETQKLSRPMREVLRGNAREPINTQESESQMLHRACSNLMRADRVLVINDEAHHCYREKQPEFGERAVTEKLAREETQEVKADREAARLWITGIEALGRKVKLHAVHDLSATPFFLRGSGYSEGRLFPWVVSDFSLMDAIECGIVKLPRLPIDDAAVTDDKIPIFRNLYKHVHQKLPKSNSGKRHVALDPQRLPTQLIGALETLYSNYAKRHEQWAQSVSTPPVFIIVCNNTATSKLVFDYVSGYPVNNAYRQGKLPLFSNIGKDDKPIARPHTLLIDSRQLESGEGLTDAFKKIAAAEIAAFKDELRTLDRARDINKITDSEILREVMNTVGKEGKLGEQVRCVVSVSMLSEGWDASNVTHILGVRRFGTQLLCEQVVGRGLRRMNYVVDQDGLLEPEYAEVFGVPFNFTGGGQPPPPRPRIRVRALPERKHLAITFPRVAGYHYQPGEQKLVANFTEDSQFEITPEHAPPETQQQGIVGAGVKMSMDELKSKRYNEVVFHLAAYIAERHYRDEKGAVPPARFRDLMPIVREWMANHLTCTGGTYPAYLLWAALASTAADRIYRACIVSDPDEAVLQPQMDPYIPHSNTASVDFYTTKVIRYQTSPEKSHVNLAICDSEWELDFCKMLEGEKAVASYVRNDGLNFSVPYLYEQEPHYYFPDFIVRINDGKVGEPNDQEQAGAEHATDNLLNLVVEIKGLRDAKAEDKADTMRRLWVPAMNNYRKYGRWAFVEIRDMQNARAELAKFIKGNPTLNPMP